MLLPNPANNQAQQEQDTSSSFLRKQESSQKIACRAGALANWMTKVISYALALFIIAGPAAAQTVTVSASGNCGGTAANCGTADKRDGDRDTNWPGLQVDEGDRVTFTLRASGIPAGITSFIIINTIWTGSAYNTADLRGSVGGTPLVPSSNILAISSAGSGTTSNAYLVATDGIAEGDETITVTLDSFHATSAPGFTLGTPSSVTVTIRGTDTAPSFGSETVSDQTFNKYGPITEFQVPAATGGNGGPTTYTTTTLPTGLSFDADGSGDCPGDEAREICGTPTADAGNYTVTIIADDADCNPGANLDCSLASATTATADQARLSFTITIRTIDYDANNNGLIEIRTLAQLNAIRWDLDGDGDVSSGNAANYLLAFPNRDTDAATLMGCPLGTCTGYELMNDLDFDENGDGSRDDTYNTGDGWNPIGTFTATFSGNGYTIANLFINRSGTDNIGLFGISTGRLTQLGLVNVAITGRDRTGGLVGLNQGTVSTSYAGGRVTGNDSVGGLVGNNSRGTLTTSYARVQVRSNSQSGGLVGVTFVGTITTSYAIGQVTGFREVGGLIGIRTITTPTASYWDTETTGQSSSEGGTGHTTAELQTPTDYTGIYANWNVDLDNADGDDDLQTGGDDPWAFGANYQYPVLRYGRDQAQIQAQFEAQPLRPSSTGADINEDGSLNAQDALLMYQTYLPGVRGAGVAADDRGRATA